MHFTKLPLSGQQKRSLLLKVLPFEADSAMFDNYRVIDRLKWWNYGTFAKDKREKFQRLIAPKGFGSIKKIIFSISLPYEVALRA